MTTQLIGTGDLRINTFKRLRTIGTAIDHISDYGGYVGVLLLIAMTIIILFEIIMRGVFNAPTKWAEEYTTYALIAFSFLSAAYVAKVHGHVGVDIIVSRLSERTKLGIDLFNLVLGTVFFTVFSYNAIQMTQTSIRLHVVSQSFLETLLWPTYIPVIVGGMILTLQLAKQAVSKGIFLSQMKAIPSERATIFASLGKLYVVLPLYVALMVSMALLLYQGGAASTVGVVVVLLTMLVFGMPIFLAMGIAAGIGLYFLMDMPLLATQLLIPVQSYGSLMNFVLVGAPLYMLGAGLLQVSGLGDKLFNVARLWLNWLPGNLAMATIAASAIFAAVVGESVVCAAVVGIVAVPAMLKFGYDEKLATGAAAAGGTLGILIPPSISFILYGYITQTSVGQLFIAGIIPGIILTLFFMTYVFFRTVGKPRYKPDFKVTMKERISSIKDAFWILLAPIIVIGTLYSGVMTPTESAAALVAYAFLVGLITKKLRVRNMLSTLVDTTKSAGFVMMVTPMAVSFGAVLIQLRLPQAFAELILGQHFSPFVVLASIFVLLLILGCIMSAIALTLIIVPILFPLIQTLGFDPVWFGVFFVINIEMALITPPVGMNFYVISSVTGLKVEKVILGVLPYVLIMTAMLVTITLFPALATWLPSTMK